MLNDKVQKQSAGDQSTNLQGGSIVINQGISYADAKEIALDVYKANFLTLAQDAASLAVQRAEKLTDDFLSRLQEEAPDKMGTMRDPSMQMAIFSAQREYAKTGDSELEDLLVDILVERAKETERTIRQIVLDESLTIAAKLTPDQMDALTVNFLITRTKNHGMLSLPTLEDYLDKYLLPFVGNLSENESCYAHLEYTGCGSAVQLGGWGTIEARFRDSYPGLFCKGFTDEELVEALTDLDNYRAVLIPCLHDLTRSQISAMDVEVLKKRCKDCGFDAEGEKKLCALFDKSRMSEAEVKDYFLRIRPKLKDLFALWDESMLSHFTLTTVGIAIAQANFRRKTGQKLDLSIWVK
ncbi:MAG TPA: hypothetical protein PKZ42_11930 [Syntrophales bacterium]|nr:hypothetical protein [Syntrophales bacterium]